MMNILVKTITKIKQIFVATIAATLNSHVVSSGSFHPAQWRFKSHEVLCTLASVTCEDSPMHLRFLKKVSVPCHVSRWTPMMDPWPKREEKFILSPLWCSRPGNGTTTVTLAPLLRKRCVSLELCGCRFFSLRVLVTLKLDEPRVPDSKLVAPCIKIAWTLHTGLLIFHFSSPNLLLRSSQPQTEPIPYVLIQ